MPHRAAYGKQQRKSGRGYVVVQQSFHGVHALSVSGPLLATTSLSGRLQPQETCSRLLTLVRSRCSISHPIKPGVKSQQIERKRAVNLPAHHASFVCVRVKCLKKRAAREKALKMSQRLMSRPGVSRTTNLGCGWWLSFDAAGRGQLRRRSQRHCWFRCKASVSIHRRDPPSYSPFQSRGSK